jgi:transcriptional regulator with XRE-family HTH domain
MGRSRRPMPARLAEKLRAIRERLGLTQEQMFERLGDTKTALYVGYIGLYEVGQREPPSLVLLRYARIAGVHVDDLIDDELDLPDNLHPKPQPKKTRRRVEPIAKRKSS